MEFGHNNVSQVVQEDRLSSLPDELIHKILSFFDMKFVVQTSVLSSRWEFLWTAMPCLNFSSGQFGTSPRFSEFVTHVLSHRSHQIEVSSLKLEFNGSANQDFLIEIANYAFSHNVQELTVVNLSTNGQVYPPCLFSSQSLKHFRVTCNHMEFSTPTQTPLDFPALTTLYISHIKLCGDIFSTCVNLKNLTLQRFFMGGDVFDINTPRLSNLTLIQGTCVNVINVNAPQLENLTVINCAIEYLNAPPGLSSFFYTASSHFTTSNYWSQYLLEFSNDRFHSLNKVTLSIACLSRMPYREEDARKTIKLLKELRNAKFLTLNADIVECISSFPHLFLDSHLPFSKLISLTINSSKMYDAHKVKMSTEARNFLLDNSPGVTLILKPELCKHDGA